MIVHIAGLDVTVDDHQHRQRCAWCGAVLFDLDLARVAVPAGQDTTPSRWEPGALVAVDGGMSWVVEDQADSKLPPEACARLPHDITGHQEPR